MRFPVFALLAPIVTSLVLFLVTKSPYTLLFALMGPVMAVASYGDGRLGERRRAKTAAANAAIVEADEEAARLKENDRQRSDQRQAHPAPGQLSALDPRARPPWNPDLAAAGIVRLGLTGSNAPRQGRNGVPLLIPSDAGIVCVGNPIFSLALARALWMQLAWNVAPETLAQHPVGYARDVLFDAEAWPLRMVESEAAIPPAARFVVEILSPNEGRLSDRDNPRGGATGFIPDYITEVEANTFARRLAQTSRQIDQARPGAQLPLHCDLAEVMTKPSASDGGGRDDGGDDIGDGAGAGANFRRSVARTTLLTNVGVSSAGIFGLDLVTHGPHAVVTGMTGSGKTEFLLSWLLSAAMRYSPKEFTVLIIDFKGGSGFARVAGLPHCLGVMTDLDVDAAQRALQSVGAEVRFRERVLNEAGMTDFAALPDHVSLARLAIVVDEYRALLDRFPELQPLFLDIAARGRALGIHLILGTQRATGVLADGILANCALRVVFRVNNVTDSVALLETDAARTLPEIPGRAALLGTSLALTYVHIARASSADAILVAEHATSWLDAHPLFVPRRPWLPALPPSISLAELDELAPVALSRHLTTPTTQTTPTTTPTAPASKPLMLGLCDEPENQRQSVADYLPARDGHLLVTGAQGSGRSTALRLLAVQASEALACDASDAERAWDVITHPVRSGTLVFIDDMEALLAQFTLEHRDVFLEAVMALLRTGPSRGVFVIIASHANALSSAAWAALMKSTLALGQLAPTTAVRDMSVLGRAGLGSAGVGPAGRALWLGNTIQVALPPGRDSSSTSTAPLVGIPLMTWQPGRLYVVVTPRPRLLMSELAAVDSGSLPIVAQFTDIGRAVGESLQVSSTAEARVYVGDVEDWQSQYSLLAQLRATGTFVFHDCSSAEVRAVRRSRDVLPHTNRGTAICVTPEGEKTRVRLT